MQFSPVPTFGGRYDDSDSQSGAGSSKDNEKKGGGDKDRKGIINRVNRELRRDVADGRRLCMCCGKTDL